MNPQYGIELYNAKQHDVASFDCGTQALDMYLKQRAHQESRKKVAAVYLLHEVGEKETIGYYTLSSSSIKITSLPESLSRRLPRYDVMPAVLLGRLAVTIGYQKKGIGKYLLIDALKRAYDLSHHIGLFAIVVDAKDINKMKFYEKYGFMQIDQQTMKLFLPMNTIKQLLLR